MNQSITVIEKSIAARHIAIPQNYKARERENGLVKETLPFTVRLVGNQAELDKAVQIRHSAYARHLPELAKKLQKAEAMDFEPSVVVLLAESKVDGSPLGTMRIQTNEFSPLTLEQSIELPDWLKKCPMAEATRLGITQDRSGRLVKAALFKAFYQYCNISGIDWMVVTGRSPIDRQYEALMFEDVYPGIGFIPMRHVFDIPHRVMSLQVCEVEKKWRNANNALYNFFFNTYHSDLQTSLGNGDSGFQESISLFSELSSS